MHSGTSWDQKIKHRPLSEPHTHTLFFEGHAPQSAPRRPHEQQRGAREERTEFPWFASWTLKLFGESNTTGSDFLIFLCINATHTKPPHRDGLGGSACLRFDSPAAAPVCLHGPPRLLCVTCPHLSPRPPSASFYFFIYPKKEEKNPEASDHIEVNNTDH